jgi:type I restriction enzyme R subunit
MQLQDTFALLMHFRQRRDPGEIIRLTLPDEIARRHWIVFGPAGEGAFVESYREQVEAFIRDLADENPVLQRLRDGQELAADELDGITQLLDRPDLFVTEDRLRQAYDLPDTSLADFLGYILKRAELPSREKEISRTFDEWVAHHPRLNATQLMFVRTLRQAVLSRARVATLEELEQPPFSRVGEARRLFTEPELNELLQLSASFAA